MVRQLLIALIAAITLSPAAGATTVLFRARCTPLSRSVLATLRFQPRYALVSQFVASKLVRAAAMDSFTWPELRAGTALVTTTDILGVVSCVLSLGVNLPTTAVPLALPHAARVLYDLAGRVIKQRPPPSGVYYERFGNERVGRVVVIQ